MVGIVSRPDAQQKLRILSTDAQYDLACACGSTKDEHRRRNSEGGWIYPVTLPSGGTGSLLKTLLSNNCSNDCKYCPLRQQMDIQRCALEPEETARVFLDYHNQGKVFGLFLSSAMFGTPDTSMDKINAVARILRKKHRFRGYIHLKIIPGASPAAIEDALSLSDAVSLNIETPGQEYLEKLSARKNYIRDIIEPMKLISKLTAKGSRFERVRQTTQFIVGAAGENDRQIVKYMYGLYQRLNMHRVYFSAYQKDPRDETREMMDEPGETMQEEKNNNHLFPIANQPTDVLVREHRLYQVDFLIRKYGFSESDIIFQQQGNLSLMEDPKQIWVKLHPEIFPVNINKAPKNLLLKVPGLGPIAAKRIIEARKQGRLNGIEELGKFGARLKKTEKYLVFS
jgi:predicted DNA-binding helix-hairpin-helix protein